MERRAESTYGFLTRELYDPDNDTHECAKRILDPDDECYWVETIENFVSKVSRELNWRLELDCLLGSGSYTATQRQMDAIEENTYILDQ